MVLGIWRGSRTWGRVREGWRELPKDGHFCDLRDLALIFIKNLLVTESVRGREVSLGYNIYGEMLIPKFREFGTSSFVLRGKWEELL